jgi:hypothetical protein
MKLSSLFGNLFPRKSIAQNKNSASVRLERSKTIYPTGMTEEKITVEINGLSPEDAIGASRRLSVGSSHNLLNGSDDDNYLK